MSSLITNDPLNPNPTLVPALDDAAIIMVKNELNASTAGGTVVTGNLWIWVIAILVYVIVVNFVSPGTALALSVLLVLGALVVNQTIANQRNGQTVFQLVGISSTGTGA